MSVVTRKRTREVADLEFPCVECQREVTGRHHALQCDGCSGWQHRKCGTGLSLADYRAAIQGAVVQWKCRTCQELDLLVEEDMVPQGESTRTSEIHSEMEVEDASHHSLEEEFEYSQVVQGDSVRTSAILSDDDDFSYQSAEDGLQALDATTVVDGAIEEESLVNEVIDHDLEPEVGVQYEVLEGAAQRGGRLLVDSRGYTYVVKRASLQKTVWRCSVRNKELVCQASIKEERGNFTSGEHRHCHPSDPNRLATVKLLAAVKRGAKEEVFRPAAAIVEDKLLGLDGQAAVGVSMANLTRTANRVRQAMRPRHPTTLDFVLQEDAVPNDFLLADVTAGNARHLVLSTPEQRAYLAKARCWFIDGTFKVVREPFTQLLSIQGFVKKGGEVKQVPLLFVLMSRRRRRDYVAVLEAVRHHVAELNVREATLDFETALWRALQEVFPQVALHGCSFHWKQAVWKRCQELGLQRGYREDRNINQLIREVLALPFVPAQYVRDVFAGLRTRADTPAFQELFQYMENQWFTGYHSPGTWVCYRRATRTNNNVEGWHNRLNRRAGKANVGLYELVILLHTQARLVPVQAKLLSQMKLARRQRKSAQTCEARLFSLWERYPGAEDAGRLLRACAALYGNVHMD